MSDIFLSHVAEDAATALQIAFGLETVGYRTWCYEVDSVPGPSYLRQTGEAIERSHVVVLLISSSALGSHQVTKEVDRAHECATPFLPVLCDVTHEEFQRRQPEWKQAVGTATSIRISSEGVTALVPDLLRGLDRLGVRATGAPDEVRIALIRRKLEEIEKDKGKSGITPPRAIPAESVPQAREVRPAPPTEQQFRSQPQLQRSRLLLTLPFVVTALVLAPLALWRKSASVEIDLKVNQFSFVIGPQIPDHLFSGLKTKALTLQGIQKIAFGDGTLETVATRDPQTDEPTTWQSLGQRRSVSIVAEDPSATSVTLQDTTLNDLFIQPRSRLTLLWLSEEPRLLRLHFDDSAVAGQVAVPQVVQFSCAQCRITDGSGHEEAGAEYRFASDSAHVIEFQGYTDGAGLGFEVAEKTALTEMNIPIADGLEFTQRNRTEPESTIIGDGKIVIEEVQKEVGVRRGDFVVLGQLQNFLIRELSLDNDGIHVAFHGRVGELRIGPARFVEERLPSVLEWIYQRQAWLLYLNAVVLIGATVVAILERFQVLRKAG